MKDTTRDDSLKLFEIRVDVQSESMHGDPLANLHTNRGDLFPSYPNAGHPFFSSSFDAKLSKRKDDRFFKGSEVPVDVR